MSRLATRWSPSKFEVPDDSDDSLEEQSREASVQVLDSHPRTFSVPSTDSESESEESEGESIEVASSILGDDHKDSAPTTPDHGRTANNAISIDFEDNLSTPSPERKVQGLKLKGPSIADVLSKPEPSNESDASISETDVINAEDKSPKILSLDDETDDDGPEALPIHQNVNKVNKNPDWKEPKPLRHQYPLPTITDYEADLDTEDQIERFIVETKARASRRNSEEKYYRRQSTDVLSESAIGATDGFDSTDDDGFDQDDEFSNDDGAETLMDSTNDASSDLPSRPEANPLQMLDLPQVRMEETNDKDVSMLEQTSFSTDRPNDSGSTGHNASQAAIPEVSHYRSTIQRAPSPSDAALARNLNPVLNVGNDGNIYRSGMHNFYDHNGYEMQMQQNGLSDGPFGYQAMRSISYPDLPGQDRQSRPYDQGPFIINPYQTMMMPDLQPYPLTHSTDGGVLGQHADGAVAAERTSSSFQNIEPEARYAASLQTEQNVHMSDTRTTSKDKQTQPLSQRKENESQFSKINIASLVNGSHMDNARPPKRKAAEISTAPHGPESQNEPSSVLPSAPSISRNQKISVPASSLTNEETQLPDAQPRSVPVNAGSLTQESAMEPFEDSRLESAVAQADHMEGPPQKRTRTSSESSRGIGKFVSGVCFGLVGAFAAFVATIPASVREEALRELGNAA